MATIEVIVTPGRGIDRSDPYRYGWRTIEREQPDGAVVVEQAPLTLEDVLHPEEGDQVTHAEAHERRCVYLYSVFRDRLAGDPTAVVLKDVRVAWDVADLKPHGPDLAVILGVRERKNWSTFDVREEGVRPALIVEVTSPETASLDRSAKFDEYDLARVPLYVIVDSVLPRREPELRLLGYQREPAGRYQPLAPNERGWLWLEPLRLWVGIQDDEIICYDESAQPLGDYHQLAATNRALAEENRALTASLNEAEARLCEMEAELRRLRESR
jgi:Uma2 family endonuclease